MASLHVLRPGLCTLVVDLGRPRTRSLGVPVGGAADRFALAIGNALVGNPPDAAALEVCLAGPTVRADGDLACVVYGAPFDLAGGRQPLAAGKTFTLRAGEELRVGGTARGMRAYLCVRGGLQVPVVLGSRSGLEPLRAGADLPCVPGSIHARFVHVRREWEAPRAAMAGGTGEGVATLRVLEGSQAGWFPGEDFHGSPDGVAPTFTVSPASDRMGLRLRGEPLALPDRELLSEPVCPGTVQVTRDGQCVILGVDGQTIGGYPRIAQVISADLDELGQLRPGEQVCFRRVSLGEAEALYRQRQEVLRGWVTRLLNAELFPGRQEAVGGDDNEGT
jgi:antagonist of KipI